MTHSNPLHDPDWKRFHDEYAAERERLAKERNRLVAAGDMSSDAYQQVVAEYDRHDKACRAAFKMQHPTAQGYAAWLFRSFDVSMEDHGAGIPMLDVGFKALHTVEEVDQAWSRVHRAVSESAHDKRNSLRTGQPVGLSAFDDATAPGLSRYWREFVPRELYPQGYAPGKLLPGRAGVREWPLSQAGMVLLRRCSRRRLVGTLRLRGGWGEVSCASAHRGGTVTRRRVMPERLRGFRYGTLISRQGSDTAIVPERNYRGQRLYHAANPGLWAI